MTSKKKNKGGRPSDYTVEKGDFICKIISTTPLGLPTVCSIHDDILPHETTVRDWRLKHEEFASKYARAKMIQADILAEECLDISDNSTSETFNTDRLRIDTRKWLASKLLPKQYGEHRLLEEKTEENEQLKAELLTLRAQLDEQYKQAF